MTNDMTMKAKTIILALATALLLPNNATAGNALDDIEVKVRIGYNIGGTAPLGLPATIRSVDAYRLTPSFMVGMDVMLPMDDKWGLMTGLRFENKGMDGDVTTKNYYMEMVKGNNYLAGRYTGGVSQKVKEWMITLPVMGTLRLGQKVQLKAGPYVSVLLGKDFSGYVFDGYLRQNDPTGPKILMGHEENERATYDFTDDLRTFQMGMEVGADWQVHKRIGVSADLNWGLTGIFKSDFKTIEQTLYPIYGTISVYYKIK